MATFGEGAQGLVTNLSVLEGKELQLTVDAEAAKITAAKITGLSTGDNVLEQAQALVAEGFTVTITASANTAIATGTGLVTQPAKDAESAKGECYIPSR